MKRTIVVSTLLVLTALTLLAGPASAAHNGNNQATLTTAGTEVGNAIVNYSEGQGTFTGTTSVRLPDGEYSLTVSLNGNNVQVICTFTVTNGTGGCSEQDLTLAGFNKAEIREAGVVVAEGTFARRGNCRDADQAGSQCEANTAPRRSRV